jgi:hypothetical protein
MEGVEINEVESDGLKMKGFERIRLEDLKGYFLLSPAQETIRFHSATCSCILETVTVPRI